MLDYKPFAAFVKLKWTGQRIEKNTVIAEYQSYKLEGRSFTVS